VALLGPSGCGMASSGLAVIPANATLDLAASLVAASPIGHVVAVDGEGFPVGVVSTLDLVGAIAATGMPVVAWSEDR
jgi:hypothetical protein